MNSFIREGTLVYTAGSLRPVNVSPTRETLAQLINAQCVATLQETVRQLESAHSVGNAVDMLTTAARQLEDRLHTVSTDFEWFSTFPSRR